MRLRHVEPLRHAEQQPAAHRTLQACMSLDGVASLHPPKSHGCIWNYCRLLTCISVRRKWKACRGGAAADRFLSRRGCSDGALDRKHATSSNTASRVQPAVDHFHTYVHTYVQNIPNTHIRLSARDFQWERLHATWRTNFSSKCATPSRARLYAIPSLSRPRPRPRHTHQPLLHDKVY